MTTPDSEEPFDPERLERLSASLGKDGPRVVAELIDLMSTETPARMAELDACLTAGDLAGAAAVAHSLMGRWGVLGAERMLASCRRLEDAAGAGAEHAASLAWREMTVELQRVEDALRRLRPQFEA